MAQLTMVRSDSNRVHVIRDDGESQAVYLCAIHKGCGDVPLSQNWQPDDLQRWVQEWEPLTTDDQNIFVDDGLPNDFDFVNRDGGYQVRYRGYQLYYFPQASTEDNSVIGFWERVPVDVVPYNGRTDGANCAPSINGDIIGGTARGP